MSDDNTNAPAEQPAAPEPQPAATKASEPVAKSNRAEPLVIRSWPKIVLMWPTLVLSLICGITMSFLGMPEAGAEFGGRHIIGLIFLVVLGINLTMILYDLNLRGFVIVALLLVTLVLGLFLLDQVFNVWESLGTALSIKVAANAAFYFFLALILAFNLAIAWVITRFNYWRVEHNEIIIHRGFMHEQERHPTAQARFKLVIEDIVEYGLLGCGKLVFYFGDDDTVHELTTVLFAHNKAKKLDELLGRVAVVSH